MTERYDDNVTVDCLMYTLRWPRCAPSIRWRKMRVSVSWWLQAMMFWKTLFREGWSGYTCWNTQQCQQGSMTIRPVRSWQIWKGPPCPSFSRICSNRLELEILLQRLFDTQLMLLSRLRFQIVFRVSVPNYAWPCNWCDKYRTLDIGHEMSCCVLMEVPSEPLFVAPHGQWLPHPEFALARHSLAIAEVSACTVVCLISYHASTYRDLTRKVVPSDYQTVILSWSCLWSAQGHWWARLTQLSHAKYSPLCRHCRISGLCQHPWPVGCQTWQDQYHFMTIKDCLCWERCEVIGKSSLEAVSFFVMTMKLGRRCSSNDISCCLEIC